MLTFLCKIAHTINKTPCLPNLAPSATTLKVNLHFAPNLCNRLVGVHLLHDAIRGVVVKDGCGLAPVLLKASLEGVGRVVAALQEEQC